METFDKIKFKPLTVGWMKRNNDLMKVAVRLPRTYDETIEVLPLLQEAGASEAEVEALTADEIVPALIAALEVSGFSFGTAKETPSSSGESQGEAVPA